MEIPPETPITKDIRAKITGKDVPMAAKASFPI